MLVLQKGLILPVPMYGGSYFFIQPSFLLPFCSICAIINTDRRSPFYKQNPGGTGTHRPHERGSVFYFLRLHFALSLACASM